MFLRIRLFAVLFLPATCGLLNAQPLSPEESLARMEIEPGFKIEIFAAEPHVVDPVAMTFDAEGRIYVAEMREMEVLPALEPGTNATIRLLEDRDGDGRVDHNTIFADGLSFPSGLAPFDGGVFVLATPDLIYLKDTNGDGRADERRVVLTGFAQGNAEHRFNNLTWSVENWIYAANGSGGGAVYDPAKTDGAKVDLRSRDFRLNPWTGEFGSVSRQVSGGFGLTFDDWGRRFVTHNEIHLMHVVLPEHYLSRNSALAVGQLGEDISDHGRPDAKVYPISGPQAWRIERTSRRAAQEANRFRPTQLQANGYFTASCGVTVYRADLFPESHRGNLFVCDAAGNLVHRDVLSEDGVSMRASRANEGTEFLRSSDSWFRPVNLAVGPDGALYVLDFYREIIETAASIPPDILSKLDLRAGADRGRIYRITPDEAKPTAYPNLQTKTNSELLELLSHPNAWHRLTAQRLLIERKASDAASELKRMAREGKNELGRLHALWTLEGLDELDEATVSAALDDSHPRIREHAIRLAEQFFEK